MQTSFLADQPQFLEPLAHWLHEEWGDLRPGTVVDARIRQLEAQMRREALPITLVAHEGPVLLGSASLTPHDLPERGDLTPWLASVYVNPKQRERGIGTRLVHAVEALAAELGFETLHLFTFDRESFYLRLRWSVLESGEHAGRPITIMQKPVRRRR